MSSTRSICSRQNGVVNKWQPSDQKYGPTSTQLLKLNWKEQVAIYAKYKYLHSSGVTAGGSDSYSAGDFVIGIAWSKSLDHDPKKTWSQQSYNIFATWNIKQSNSIFQSQGRYSNTRHLPPVLFRSRSWREQIVPQQSTAIWAWTGLGSVGSYETLR